MMDDTTFIIILLYYVDQQQKQKVIDEKKCCRRECCFCVHLSAEGRQRRDRRIPVFRFGREVLFQWSFLV